MMKQMHTGFAARWSTIVALRIAPSDESAYGHLLYLIELPNPPLLRASGVAGLVLDVRNVYESRIGRFEAAGAETLCPSPGPKPRP